MNKYIKIVVLCLISFIPVVPAVAGVGPERDISRVTVNIDYGQLRPARTVEMSLPKGGTVLEALQRVAAVETHPVGPYVIVAGIDGVEGKRGETAWYYTVDGVSAEKLAMANVIDKAVHITWRYQEDVCSRKVDK